MINWPSFEKSVKLLQMTAMRSSHVVGPLAVPVAYRRCVRINYRRLSSRLTDSGAMRHYGLRHSSDVITNIDNVILRKKKLVTYLVISCETSDGLCST